MAYKEKLELSEIEPYLLEGLKDFIEEILDLYSIYGDKVKMPVAIPPKRYIAVDYPDYFSNQYYIANAMSSPFTFRRAEDDPIKGIYQDEAILKESADRRLNKIITLKKLGVIHSVSVDELPLERREISFYINSTEIKNLLAEIEQIIHKKEQEEKERREAEKKEDEIYYSDKNGSLNLREKSFKISGWEDAVCKVFFNGSEENRGVDLGEIVLEMTGEEYHKSDSSDYMEKVRQAVYRLNKKIDKKFGRKDYLDFSIRTRRLTKTQTDS